MLKKIDNALKELTEIREQIETFNKKERAYKYWLRKFKKENESLLKKNIEICQQRDNALTELSIQQKELLKLAHKNPSQDNKVKELIFANKIVCKQRDEALTELSIKRDELLKSLHEAKQAKQNRDIAINNLDEVIGKLEAYQNICERFKNEISDSDQSIASLLIKEAERLLFEEQTTPAIEIKLDRQENPQMFTDPASINRSLLDR